MGTLKNLDQSWRVIAASTALLATFAHTAGAIDLQQCDYMPQPEGTSFISATHNYQTTHRLTEENQSSIGNRTYENVNISSIRLVHYEAVDDIPVVVGIFQSAGTYGARLSGVQLNDATGVGDSVLLTGFWPINRPDTGTYLGIASFTTVPDGQYNPSRTDNMGGNRWVEDNQMGLLQAVSPRIMLELLGDLIHYTDNDNAGANGHKVLSQAPSTQFQSWLTYFILPQWNIAAGYDQRWGGSQELNGVTNYMAVNETQIRLATQYVMDNRVSMMFSAFHDMSRDGGLLWDKGFYFSIAKGF